MWVQPCVYLPELVPALPDIYYSWVHLQAGAMQSSSLLKETTANNIIWGFGNYKWRMCIFIQLPVWFSYTSHFSLLHISLLNKLFHIAIALFHVSIMHILKFHLMEYSIATQGEVLCQNNVQHNAGVYYSSVMLAFCKGMMNKINFLKGD